MKRPEYVVDECFGDYRTGSAYTERECGWCDKRSECKRATVSTGEFVKLKPSNPKDAVGMRKPPSSTVSQAVMAEVGVGMLEGGIKYGRHNYRVIGVRGSVYYDATRRHIDAWWEGQDVDPDSGLNHITKAICSLVVLRDAMIQGKFTDDRPPPTPEEHREYVQGLVDSVFKRMEDGAVEPKNPYTKEDA